MSADATTTTDDVLARRDGALGRITLNRPKAINALTLEMVRAIETALDGFLADEAVRVVLLDGAGERGFCAGGDIVGLRDSALGDGSAARAFWAEEYHLNARIARCAKPVVAVMDGIVMGGGIGLAGHAAHRLATERLVSAMPEVGIGFAPDVGGTWLLSRPAGELGTHLALTGERLGARDAIAAGLADHVVASSAIEALIGDLAAGTAPEVAIDRAAAVPVEVPDGRPPEDLAWIDAAYAHDDVEAILADLDARPEEAAAKAATALRRGSPTSLKVTLRALRDARGLPDLESALEREYRISTAFLDHPDFVEGIRAQVVDKDRSPSWTPPRIEDVGPADVARFLAPADPDLELPRA
jgi:enoyl-CoA hydratase